MKKKVVSFKSLPARLPFNSTVIWYFLLDKINAPGWGWVFYFGGCGFFWTTAILAIATSEYIELFKDEKP